MSTPSIPSRFPDRMSAADYRRLVGLGPAGAVEATPSSRGRWGIPGRASAKPDQDGADAPEAKSKKPKYRNKVVVIDGEKYDSGKELDAFRMLTALRLAADPSERVVRIERQVWFEVIPKQDGERAANYVADFVAHMANGARRVIDVKSVITRKLPAYVLKRKLMFQVHGIRIEEM